MLPAVQTDMAGQLMVHYYEAKQLKLFQTGPTPPPFLDLPWEEAIAAFRERKIVSEDEFSKLLDSYRFRSDQARRLLLQQLQERTVASLDKALAEGTTFAEFVADMEETGDALGIGVNDHNYLSTVFRTNLQTAYGAGRYRAIIHPDVMAARPYVQYRTTGDTRVRPSHAVLDGMVFRTESLKWRKVAPPGGFSCRCSAVTMDDDDLRAEGLQVSDDVPPEGEPDPGFGKPPLELVEEELE